jgi:hypothetical protein
MSYASSPVAERLKVTHHIPRRRVSMSAPAGGQDSKSQLAPSDRIVLAKNGRCDPVGLLDLRPISGRAGPHQIATLPASTLTTSLVTSEFDRMVAWSRNPCDL